MGRFNVVINGIYRLKSLNYTVKLDSDNKNAIGYL